ncbi:MAG: 50S ribosomal protein L25 [Eubacteriales bacterium]|nr:50S ribosomal protein L25 [Eubacteriales bacterium]
MDEFLIKAEERDPGKRRYREPGTIAGVLYGDGIEGSLPVSLQASPLQKLISVHGSHARLTLLLNNDEKIGILKEIQKNPMSGNIIHADIQLVSKTQEVKTKIPLVFTGREEFHQKELRLQVLRSEVEVQGVLSALPESIEIDVSSAGLGYSITLADLNLGDKIRILDREDEVYAQVVHLHAVAEEPEAEEEGAEEEEAASEGSDTEDSAAKGDNSGAEA